MQVDRGSLNGSTNNCRMEAQTDALAVRQSCNSNMSAIDKVCLHYSSTYHNGFSRGRVVAPIARNDRPYYQQPCRLMQIENGYRVFVRM